MSHQGLSGTSIGSHTTFLSHSQDPITVGYPGEFCGFSEQSYMEVLGWTRVRLYSMGHIIPTAVAAGKRIGLPLEQMGGIAVSG